MRLPIIRAFIFAFVAALVIVPVSARAAESHVWVNNTTKKSVWITAFTSNCSFEIHGAERTGKPSKTACLGTTTERHIVHEWCVPAGSALSKQGFHVVLTVVHILATEHANCGRPILQDWTMQFPHNNGSQNITREYRIVTKYNDHYVWYDVEQIAK